jgi:hypothetical protein
MLFLAWAFILHVLHSAKIAVGTLLKYGHLKMTLPNVLIFDHKYLGFLNIKSNDLFKKSKEAGKAVIRAIK